MKLFRINSLWSAVRALLGWPLLLVGSYFAAALIGSLIPVNANWREPKDGVTIYIYDNGIHAGLILARRDGTLDHGVLVADFPVILDDSAYYGAPPSDLPKVIPPDRFPGDIDEFPYIMIGWGDADFYRNTPTWGDLRPRTAITALTGSGEALMHVDRLRSIPPNATKKLILRDHEFARLLDFVAAHFSPTVGFMPQVERGYGPDDRFYKVSSDAPKLRYSALFTCNNWVGEALKVAGVKTGYWTPLPFGIMQRH